MPQPHQNSLTRVFGAFAILSLLTLAIMGIKEKPHSPTESMVMAYSCILAGATLLSTLFAAILYVWLHAISAWKYFDVLWSLIAVVIMGWLIIGCTTSICHVMPAPGQPKDPLGIAIAVLFIFPALVEMPMSIIVCVSSVPLGVALFYAMSTRIRVKRERITVLNSSALYVGLLITIILACLAGWHFYIVAAYNKNAISCYNIPQEAVRQWRLNRDMLDW